jgi:hypothetical protein
MVLDGCPMFAPAYMGRKRWAKPNDRFRVCARTLQICGNARVSDSLQIRFLGLRLTDRERKQCGPRRNHHVLFAIQPVSDRGRVDGRAELNIP